MAKPRLPKLPLSQQIQRLDRQISRWLKWFAEHGQRAPKAQLDARSCKMRAALVERARLRLLWNRRLERSSS